ncbi:hypothetical protein M5689_006014 [Euphorbia peplus]|nr:hypothetical protein M5689_006014 [Euphorbia peplus]
MENLGTPGNGSPFKHLRMDTLNGSLVPRNIPPPDSPAAGHFKKKSRRKFVRLIKAILFETTLANKIRKKANSKKKKQCSNGDSPSIKIEKKDTYPVMATTFNKKFGKKYTAKVISGTPSVDTSSVMSSSSCASSVASNSMRLPDTDIMNLMEQNQKNDQEKGKGYYGFNTGLCLILVALLVLVIWGKLFAILCSSAWLFFVPNWGKGKKTLLFLKSRFKRKSDESSSSVDKEEYNKKIT